MSKSLKSPSGTIDASIHECDEDLVLKMQAIIENLEKQLNHVKDDRERQVHSLRVSMNQQSKDNGVLRANANQYRSEMEQEIRKRSEVEKLLLAARARISELENDLKNANMYIFNSQRQTNKIIELEKNEINKNSKYNCNEMLALKAELDATRGELHKERQKYISEKLVMDNTVAIANSTVVAAELHMKELKQQLEFEQKQREENEREYQKYYMKNMFEQGYTNIQIQTDAKKTSLESHYQVASLERKLASSAKESEHMTELVDTLADRCQQHVEVMARLKMKMFDIQRDIKTYVAHRQEDEEVLGIPTNDPTTPMKANSLNPPSPIRCLATNQELDRISKELESLIQQSNEIDISSPAVPRHPRDSNDADSVKSRVLLGSPGKLESNYITVNCNDQPLESNTQIESNMDTHAVESVDSRAKIDVSKDIDPLSSSNTLAAEQPKDPSLSVAMGRIDGNVQYLVNMAEEYDQLNSPNEQELVEKTNAHVNAYLYPDLTLSPETPVAFSPYLRGMPSNGMFSPNAPRSAPGSAKTTKSNHSMSPFSPEGQKKKELLIIKQSVALLEAKYTTELQALKDVISNRDKTIQDLEEDTINLVSRLDECLAEIKEANDALARQDGELRQFEGQKEKYEEALRVEKEHFEETQRNYIQEIGDTNNMIMGMEGRVCTLLEDNQRLQEKLKLVLSLKLTEEHSTNTSPISTNAVETTTECFVELQLPSDEFSGSPCEHERELVTNAVVSMVNTGCGDQSIDEVEADTMAACHAGGDGVATQNSRMMTSPTSTSHTASPTASPTACPTATEFQSPILKLSMSDIHECFDVRSEPESAPVFNVQKLLSALKMPHHLLSAKRTKINKILYATPIKCSEESVATNIDCNKDEKDEVAGFEQRNKVIQLQSDSFMKLIELLSASASMNDVVDTAVGNGDIDCTIEEVEKANHEVAFSGMTTSTPGSAGKPSVSSLLILKYEKELVECRDQIQSLKYDLEKEKERVSVLNEKVAQRSENADKLSDCETDSNSAHCTLKTPLKSCTPGLKESPNGSTVGSPSLLGSLDKLMANKDEMMGVLSDCQDMPSQIHQLQCRIQILTNQLASVPANLCVAQAEQRVLATKLNQNTAVYEARMQAHSSQMQREKSELLNLLAMEKSESAQHQETLKQNAKVIHQLTCQLKAYRAKEHALAASNLPSANSGANNSEFSNLRASWPVNTNPSSTLLPPDIHEIPPWLQATPKAYSDYDAKYRLPGRIAASANIWTNAMGDTYSPTVANSVTMSHEASCLNGSNTLHTATTESIPDSGTHRNSMNEDNRLSSELPHPSAPTPSTEPRRYHYESKLEPELEPVEPDLKSSLFQAQPNSNPYEHPLLSQSFQTGAGVSTKSISTLMSTHHPVNRTNKYVNYANENTYVESY